MNGAQATGMTYTGPAYRDRPNAERPNTEIEEVMDTLREVLRVARTSINEMHGRVVSPQPRGQADKVSPVPVTHADKLREILDLATDVKDLAGEMNGKI